MYKNLIEADDNLLFIDFPRKGLNMRLKMKADDKNFSS